MPPQRDNESSLDRIQKRLYGNLPVDTPMPDQLGARQANDVPHAWENVPMARAPKKKTSYAVLFFTGALLFFLVAGGLAVWLLLSGDRSVSTNNVDVAVTGPTSIAAGDTVPLAITIDNKNPSSLDNADLTITFPDGTRSADDVTQSYPRYEEQLDSIPAGGSVDRTVKAVIFGEQGQSISIPIELTYKTAGSNAIFVKQETYTLTVTTAPLSVTVNTLSETVSGQPLTIDVQVRSNATAAIPNAVLEAQYPFGFTVTSATPAANGAGTIPLGTLQPGDTKEVKIVGTLTGTDTESRVFHFTAGTADSTGGLSVAYTSKDAAMTLAAPFLNVNLALNGTSGDSLSVPSGQQVTGTLTWTNTLSEPVSNAVITVSLQGNALNASSIQSSNGFYQSANNTITFDNTTMPDLASLAPGATGVGTFTFSTLSGSIKNPTLSAVVSVKGQRLSEANVPENVNASVTDTIKVISNLALLQTAYHVSGPFSNGGAVPPVANSPTTYTIQWHVTNSSNDIAGATAVATLPSNVTFTNLVSPSGAVSYDSSSRQVSWNIGDLSAGASTQAFFQVSLLPSTSQHGTNPVLVGPVTLSAYDRFAASQISSTDGAATTDTPSDSGYRVGNGNVQ